MTIVTIRQLLESGIHFGHRTHRWNPRMKHFILIKRNGIYIINLQQMIADIDITYDFVKQMVARGGSILSIGTKKQAQETVAEQAIRVGIPYMSHRWLDDMPTNSQTVAKRLQRLKGLEWLDFEDIATSGRAKKELLMMNHEKEKLSRTLGGIRDMTKVPSALWIADPKKEHLAVAEARKLSIPIIAILNTSADPSEVDYRVPGSDGAIRAVSLLTRVIADAITDGLLARSETHKPTDSAETVAEPLAEWGRELLEGEAAPAEVEEAKAEGASAREAPKQDWSRSSKKRTLSMAGFTAADVKALREQTDAGMIDMKRALTEASGDAEKALEIIRLKGLKSLSKCGDHQASVGLPVAEVEDGVSVLVEVNSETDSVTKNQKFIDLANRALAVAVASRTADLKAFLTAPMGGETVQDKLNGMATIIGEKLEIRRVVRVEGENVDLYLHQTSPDLPLQVGVSVVADAAGASVAHDTATHVAAYVPAYLDRDHVPADALEKERATPMKITLEEGKPEKVINKIATGRLEAYFKDNCLVDQTFTRDPSKSVREVLEETGVKITDFVRVHVGAWRFVMVPPQ